MIEKVLNAIAITFVGVIFLIGLNQTLRYFYPNPPLVIQQTYNVDEMCQRLPYCETAGAGSDWCKEVGL